MRARDPVTNRFIKKQCDPAPKYADRVPMSPDAIAKALEAIAPNLGVPQPAKNPPLNLPEGQRANTETPVRASPLVLVSTRCWPLTAFMVDVAGAVGIASLLGMYGGAIYFLALYGVPEIVKVLQ